MTVEEILKKCEEFKIKLKVVNGKLSPVGNLSVQFVTFSHTLVPFKQQIIDYIKANRPEDVMEINPEAAKKPIMVQNTPDARIQRLRIPCINLGPSIEKAAGCNCAGKVIHECKVYGKCRRAGSPTEDVPAVCTACESYVASA